MHAQQQLQNKVSYIFSETQNPHKCRSEPACRQAGTRSGGKAGYVRYSSLFFSEKSFNISSLFSKDISLF